MKFSIIEIIMIILILILAIKIYSESDYFNLKCIISNVDGKEYCVRERKLLNQAADKLAHTTNDLKKLVSYCKTKFPNNPAVKRMVSKFNPKKVQETLPTSSYTAYSENKGEKIAFCLSSENKKDLDNLIDENTLMFVAIHEMSHVATKSIGHTQEFWTNFKFLLQQANEIHIYTPIDYKKNNQEYCGMDIKDNPFFS